LRLWIKRSEPVASIRTIKKISIAKNRNRSQGTPDTASGILLEVSGKNHPWIACKHSKLLLL
jgi:hypothetical protein